MLQKSLLEFVAFHRIDNFALMIDGTYYSNWIDFLKNRSVRQRLLPGILVLIVSLFFLNTTSSAQTRMSKSEAMDDIDTLMQIWQRSHYNPYLHISRESLLSKVTQIKKNLPDSVEKKYYLLKIYELTSILNDAHCTPYIVQPEIMSELRKANFLPFSFIFYNGSTYLPLSTAHDFGFPSDGEIKSINGFPITELFMEFSSYFGGSEHHSREMAARLFNYFIFLKGIAPPFRISYSYKSRINSQFVDSAVNFKEMIYQSMPQLAGKNSYKVLDHKVALIDFTTMSGDLNEWGALLDSAFSDIRLKKINNLCIDIRNNSGGNSLYANYLLAYITKRRFTLSGKKCWKISEDKKRYQLENDDVNKQYESQKNGTTWCFGDCNPINNPVIADTVFLGNVYFLTGPYTFSSANMLADAVKTFNLGIVVGEATGEYTNDFGETMVVTLPKSKIKVQTTTSFEFGTDCNQVNYHTIQPDVSISPSFKERLSETDKVLNYIVTKSNHASSLK